MDYLTQFKQVVVTRSSAQRNPIYEYQKEALWSYNEMKDRIYQKIVYYLSLSRVVADKNGQPIIQFA